MDTVPNKGGFLSLQRHKKYVIPGWNSPHHPIWILSLWSAFSIIFLLSSLDVASTNPELLGKHQVHDLLRVAVSRCRPFVTRGKGKGNNMGSLQPPEPPHIRTTAVREGEIPPAVISKTKIADELKTFRKKIDRAKGNAAKMELAKTLPLNWIPLAMLFDTSDNYRDYYWKKLEGLNQDANGNEILDKETFTNGLWIANNYKALPNSFTWNLIKFADVRRADSGNDQGAITDLQPQDFCRHLLRDSKDRDIGFQLGSIYTRETFPKTQPLPLNDSDFEIPPLPISYAAVSVDPPSSILQEYNDQRGLPGDDDGEDWMKMR